MVQYKMEIREKMPKERSSCLFYAHSTKHNDKSDWQKLDKHLLEVSQLTSKFAKIFGADEFGRVAGLLHDFGKYTKAFQDYLENNKKYEKIRRGKIIHSLQGAKYIKNIINDYIIADIIGNVVASHHGGLFDDITEGERTLTIKTDKDEDILHYAEAINEFCPEIDEEKLKKEIFDFCIIAQNKKTNPYFMLHLLTKAIYSCLVDADRCNSAGLEINNKIPDWRNLIQQLETYLSRFSEKTDIDKVRKNISEQCQQAGCRPQGIYTLSVPTGGGKTLSSLRFALDHAKANKLKHIIYIIPYLSILDQTAEKMRNIFMDDCNELILEHHSNIDPLEDDDREDEYRLLTSRWDNLDIPGQIEH